MTTISDMNELDMFIQDNVEIMEKYDFRKIVMKGIALLIGIAFITAGKRHMAGMESVDSIIMMVGIMLAGISAICLLKTDKFLIYKPMKTKIKRDTKFYPASWEHCLMNSERMLTEDEWPGLNEAPNGQMRVQYLVDESKSLLAFIVSKYENLMYIPQGNMKVFKGKDAAKICEWLHLS